MHTLRLMRQEDLPAVAAVESETLSPWSLCDLERELRVRQGRQLVVESSDLRIVGWCACRTIWPDAELLKITVAKNERQKGIGTSLLDALLQELQEQAYSSLFLEVRAENAAALQFYEKHGFRQVGRRPRYYSDPADDALILQRDIELMEIQSNIHEELK